jgi:hypothetical protein
MQTLWNAPENYSISGEDRTLDFISRMIQWLELPQTTVDNKQKIIESLLYLKVHTSMLTYEFNKKTNLLDKLKIGPQFLTLQKESIERQCKHSNTLYDFLKFYTSGSGSGSGSGSPIVEMSDRCNTANSGGYKSRRRNRKPARKTRRAYGRGRDRRGKYNHKKYTNRMR